MVEIPTKKPEVVLFVALENKHFPFASFYETMNMQEAHFSAASLSAEEISMLVSKEIRIEMRGRAAIIRLRHSENLITLWPGQKRFLQIGSVCLVFRLEKINVT